MNRICCPGLVNLLISWMVIFILPNVSQAQFKKAKMIKTTLVFGYQRIPSQAFIDTTGEYGEDEASVAFKTPLVSRMIKGRKAGSFGFWAVVFKASGSVKWPDFIYLEARQQLIRVSSGLSGMYYKGGKSIYLLNLNSFVAEDNYSILNPQLRLNGSALMIRNVSKVFSYNVGLAYSFVFGNGLPLPILGCAFNMGKRSRLSLILPFNISYRYQFGKTNQLMIFVRPDGGLSNISNRSSLAGYSEIIQLKHRVFQLGASCSINLFPNIKLSPEAGINSKRNISLIEQDKTAKDAFFNTQTTVGYYLKASLQIRFGRKAGFGSNDAVNYLLDNGIDNVPDGSNDKLNTD